MICFILNLALVASAILIFFIKDKSQALLLTVFITSIEVTLFLYGGHYLGAISLAIAIVSSLFMYCRAAIFSSMNSIILTILLTILYFSFKVDGDLSQYSFLSIVTFALCRYCELRLSGSKYFLGIAVSLSFLVVYAMLLGLWYVALAEFIFIIGALFKYRDMVAK